MKVLFLNTYDHVGGAAIATLRIAEAITKQGVEVKIGVKQKKTTSPFVFVLPEKRTNCVNRYFRLLKRGLHFLNRRIFRITTFKTTNPIFHSQNKGTSIDISFINHSDFDLVHLHWVHDDLISIKDLSKITKPIVWTMHDSWVFCGAEHHPNVWENDQRFVSGYTKRNKPQTTRGIDICRHTWKRKQKYLVNKPITFVSPSSFESELFSMSYLFSGLKCEIIPNITPSAIFFPQDKPTVRSTFNIPLTKKIIGFGAAGDISSTRSNKGGHFLIDALRKIERPEDYLLVVFGPAENDFVKEIHIPVFFAGYIENPSILAALYNACDVFICPSIIESFSLTSMEAMFCGIPVVAFRTGGIPDIVVHQTTGYLAPLFDTTELYKGIHYCIENYQFLSENSLKRASKIFDETELSKKYIELYKSSIR